MAENNTEVVPATTPVLVVGATGYLGRHIVEQLHRAGYPVRALARDASRLEAEQQKGVEIFTGQVTQPETLKGLCDGISVVISTLGVRSLTRKPTAWEVDYQGNLNVLNCARASGVKHFIFVGVLHGEQWRSSISVLEARERFIDTLRQSELAWTILRPTGAFNDMELIFQQAQRGRVYLMGSGQARINPIAAADIATRVAQSIEDTNARGQTYNIGGPDTFTYTDIARLAFQIQKKSPRVTHIPPWLVDGLSQALKPFNANAAGFLSFFRSVTTNDVVGTTTGQVHLSDFFAQLASQHG